MHYAYFVPRNTTKLTTRGGTSPDGVEMTLIRERKSTHRLGTWLVWSQSGHLHYQSCVSRLVWSRVGDFVIGLFPNLMNSRNFRTMHGLDDLRSL